MKISQIMLGKGFGGAERYFLDLCLALADAGHSIQAICHPNFVALPALRANGKIRLDTVLAWGKWDPLAPWKIHRMLLDFKPDVVQAHLARGALIAGKAARRSSFPLVVKTHNYVNLKYYKYVDHFISTTRDQFKYLKSHGIPENRISVIPNFSRIPAAETVRARSSGPLVFTAYGRMVRKKGFDLLLQAFAMLVSAGFNTRLLVGGDGPERTRLEKQAHDLGISQHVEFAGWISDVQLFLSRGDVFVLPSRDEPFGIAVLEAMAAGMPIIATRTMGPMEILNQGAGYLVAPNSADALLSAMKTSIENPGLSESFAIAALDLYKTRFHESIVVPQLLSLYRKVMEEKSQKI